MGTSYPRYRSHKSVEAAKIVDVVFQWDAETGVTFRLEFEGGLPPHVVSDAYARKHNPKAGGYWVRYQDGYESWSPAEAFEEGYDRLP